MKKISIKQMSMIGILIALVVVAIMLLRIPTAFGYIHLGDTFIYLSGVLGPISGFFVGGIGTALADLAAGYPMYAVASFIIHGIQGLLFALLYGRKLKKATSFQFFIGALVIGVITVVPGYYITEVIMYGSLVTPLVGIMTNSLQVLASSLIATLLIIPMRKIQSKIMG